MLYVLLYTETFALQLIHDPDMKSSADQPAAEPVEEELDEDEPMEEDGEEGDEEDEEDEEEDGKDSQEKKAAASLAVRVGSFSDYPEVQGLAHFLVPLHVLCCVVCGWSGVSLIAALLLQEHMVFMGSTKFPGENDFESFLTEHGGSSNAFTECEITNYTFEVQPEHLVDALERFAGFFDSPLLRVMQWFV